MMKKEKMSYKVISSNQREKTIRIKKTYEDGKSVIFKSIPLPKEEWDYMKHYATENDIKNFLKSDDYYIEK